MSFPVSLTTAIKFSILYRKSGIHRATQYLQSKLGEMDQLRLGLAFTETVTLSNAGNAFVSVCNDYIQGKCDKKRVLKEKRKLEISNSDIDWVAENAFFSPSSTISAINEYLRMPKWTYLIDIEKLLFARLRVRLNGVIEGLFSIPFEKVWIQIHHRQLELANRGHVGAQYDLGLIYELGRGISKDDIEAAEWFRMAAYKGHTDAQYRLAKMHEVGKGVLKHDYEAYCWYKKAADQGHADAQYNLGRCYLHGIGIPVSIEQAFTWYSKAADQDHADAQYNLAEMYIKGMLKPDANVTYGLIYRAAEHGKRVAEKERDRLSKYLTNSETQAGKRIANKLCRREEPLKELFALCAPINLEGATKWIDRMQFSDLEGGFKRKYMRRQSNA